jgi:hypothetical protein
MARSSHEIAIIRFASEAGEIHPRGTEGAAQRSHRRRHQRGARFVSRTAASSDLPADRRSPPLASGRIPALAELPTATPVSVSGPGLR